MSLQLYVCFRRAEVPDASSLVEPVAELDRHVRLERVAPGLDDWSFTIGGEVVEVGAESCPAEELLDEDCTPKLRKLLSATDTACVFSYSSDPSEAIAVWSAAYALARAARAMVFDPDEEAVSDAQQLREDIRKGCSDLIDSKKGKRKSATRARVSLDWARGTGLAELGHDMLGRRVGGLLFGLDLCVRNGQYEPKLFFCHLASTDDTVHFSWYEPLRNEKRAPDQIPLRAHAARYEQGVASIVKASPIPLDGTPVDPKHVFKAYRASFNHHHPALHGPPYADMALIASDARGVEAGRKILEEARKKLAPETFARFVAPVEALVLDLAALREAVAAAVQRLELGKAPEVQWKKRHWLRG